MSKLRIVLIGDDLEHSRLIQESLLCHGFQVVACIMANELPLVEIKGLHAEVILLTLEHPQPDILASCVSHHELPTVLFTPDANKDTIRSAINAGVTTYIVDAIDPTKLENILEISIAQFRRHNKLLHDLKEIREKLSDRRDIDKAKVLLIQLHVLSEEQAFALLRKNAMSQRITLGEMARRLLDAQKLLSGQ